MPVYYIGATWGLSLPYPHIRRYDNIICNGKTIGSNISVGKTENMKKDEQSNWFCYRRNYISVDSSFSLDVPYDQSQLYLESTGVPIHGFGLSMSVKDKVNDYDEPVKLMQYTSKRERGPKSDVRIHYVNPEMNTFNNISSKPGVDRDPSLPYSVNTTIRYWRHRFQHIQFRKATNNRRVNGILQGSVSVSIDLYADVRSSKYDNPVWVKVVSRLSESVAVKGKSPCYETKRNLGEGRDAFETN